MVITVAVSFIYMAQAMAYNLVRDSFLLEAHGGDFQAFNDTSKFLQWAAMELTYLRTWGRRMLDSQTFAVVTTT